MAKKWRGGLLGVVGLGRAEGRSRQGATRCGVSRAEGLDRHWHGPRVDRGTGKFARRRILESPMALSTAPPAAPAPPRVLSVTDGSAAARAGIVPGDEILAIDGAVPRDVLEYQRLVDEADVVVSLRRGGIEIDLEVPKREGELFGVEVHAALFDQVRTCDNHCEF